MARRSRLPPFPFWSMGMLAAEAGQVVALRLAKLARGDAAARREAERMVSEKVSAGIAEAGHLLAGGSLDASVRRTRRAVRANARRLTATKG